MRLLASNCLQCWCQYWCSGCLVQATVLVPTCWCSRCCTGSTAPAQDQQSTAQHQLSGPASVGRPLRSQDFIKHGAQCTVGHTVEAQRIVHSAEQGRPRQYSSYCTVHSKKHKSSTENFKEKQGQNQVKYTDRGKEEWRWTGAQQQRCGRERRGVYPVSSSYSFISLTPTPCLAHSYLDVQFLHIQVYSYTQEYSKVLKVEFNISGWCYSLNYISL